MNERLPSRCSSRRSRHLIVSALIALALLASTSLPILAQRRTKRPIYIIPAGATLRARLNQAITSKSARVGETFTSAVVDPVYVKGVEVIPAGSIVTGKVTQVTSAARKGRAGSISVVFTSIDTPKPNHYAINGSLASAGGESDVTGGSSKKRNASFIGRGAVVGGLMNGAAGVATGATIGVARGLIKKGHEADVKSGTEFNIILNQSLSTVAFR